MARTPEQQREYQRQWALANKDRVREYGRRYRETNRARIAEQNRERYRANPEPARARARKWYQENLERARETQRRYGEVHRHAYQEERRRLGKDRIYHLRRTHGLHITEWWAMWDAQDGRCYLCHRDLDEDPTKTHVEHHHSCRAHDPSKSCRYSRRGLACSSCNTTIGLNGDDPDRLRMIADRLEAANLDVEARQAAAPQQLDLGFGETA